jgi:hypothetical protein
MSEWKQTDPFELLVAEEEPTEFLQLSDRAVRTEPAELVGGGAATARFCGFDLEEQPLVTDIPGVPGEVLPARSVVGLSQRDVGATVVLLFEQNDLRRPLVMGVLREARSDSGARLNTTAASLAAQVDDQRVVLTAEREIVLQCGAASITLTRAGKVIIKGAYVLSRSSGCNKIKGAMVDIN